MHDVYEVSKLLKYSVQIESITVYGNKFHYNFGVVFNSR